jgi:hypothetical protein
MARVVRMAWSGWNGRWRKRVAWMPPRQPMRARSRADGASVGRVRWVARVGGCVG